MKKNLGKCVFKPGTPFSGRYHTYHYIETGRVVLLYTYTYIFSWYKCDFFFKGCTPACVLLYTLLYYRVLNLTVKGFMM